MNCRPGDLARVLSPGRRISCPLCGDSAIAVKPDTLVVVTTHDGIAWILQEPIIVNVSLKCGAHIIARCTALEDRCLKPIRDPGPDAIDEIVAKVGPAPMTLTELLRREEVSHG